MNLCEWLTSAPVLIIALVIALVLAQLFPHDSGGM